MKYTTPQNNFLAYFAFLVAFFVLLFFTKNIFTEIQVVMDEKEQASIEYAKKGAELSLLNELKDRLVKNEGDILEEIKAFSGEFSSVNMLNYIHSYAGKINAGEDRIIIREMNFSTDIESDIGFRKAEISLSTIVSSETTLFNFINYLTNEGEYRFYISNFDYPLVEGSNNIQVIIPLTLYYK